MKNESRTPEAVKHTPGPWNHYKGTYPHATISRELNGALIAITYDDESEANARLIAAAPEMLEAAKGAHQLLAQLIERVERGEHSDIKEFYDRAMQLNFAVVAAILKAEGK